MLATGKTNGAETMACRAMVLRGMSIMDFILSTYLLPMTTVAELKNLVNNDREIQLRLSDKNSHTVY
jgi:hypothetical protein